MAKVKRLRIFAGPNGSGKSTFINRVRQQPPTPNFKLGYYINADDIERTLKNNQALNFKDYGLRINSALLKNYFKKSKFAPVKLNQPDLYTHFNVQNQGLNINPELEINSYIAADLAEFIRQQQVKNDFSFSYETVMSDINKIEFLKKAKKQGYKIYLYYFATEDPEINISRVNIRVKQNGHDVKKEIVEERYYKSLSNLKSAIRLTDRAYLFDSSKRVARLIAEITAGRSVKMIDLSDTPNWFIKYVAS